MNFVLVRDDQKADICVEGSAFSGVRKIVNKVMDDVTLVTEQKLQMVEQVKTAKSEYVVLVATIGYSQILEQLEMEGMLDLSAIRGKREVYKIQFLSIDQKKVLLIAGSDKRGTIYGAFHISELMGVSPWVYFADVQPKKQAEVVFDEQIQMISKEPSVKYRGFFINDEWPSFGNWTFEKFGGFTVQMYDHVFELLLRLKGNYLWPAMWTSNFSLDGPGLGNAILADEYGIVMSNSHHEPCLRHSEEWDLVKGPNTKYGTEWNFDRNKEGLSNYWRDALKRSGKFENIITMGMRGERDSEILGHEAGLAENIQYLKDVLATQNQLIREEINQDLDQVPRMIALYKEVEAYYYGDDKTPGLRGYEELDGITLMLCEDNFGNMRYLPEETERNHKGGYGMYYHFDYHGGPISYEWVNSTAISKVWEQMGMAYDAGVREIWIVNVGDLKPQELPISYFMDLAYDFDQWGSECKNVTVAYTRKWVAQQFGAFFTEEECERIFELVDGYSTLNAISKPEATRPDTYHPVREHISDQLLERTGKLLESADNLLQTLVERQDIKNVIADSNYAAFVELVYYPAVASLNVLRWNLYAGKNHFYAARGALIANRYAEKMTACYEKDLELKQMYHELANGKWNHMMSSEHVGFINWNDEDARMPIRMIVDPSEKPRMIVSAADQESYSIGTEWTNKVIHFYHLLDPTCQEIDMTITNGAKREFGYELSCDQSWITLSKKQGKVTLQDVIKISVDESKRTTIPNDNGIATACISVDSSFAHVKVYVHVLVDEKLISMYHYVPCVPDTVYVNGNEQNLKLVIGADEFTVNKEGKNGRFEVLSPFGKYGSAVKAFPAIVSFDEKQVRPSLEYNFYLPEEMDCEVALHFAPSNPIHVGQALRFYTQWNQNELELHKQIGNGFSAGDTTCMDWCKGVLRNERIVELKKHGGKGNNTLKFIANEPGVVLERIVIKKCNYAKP